MNFKAAFLVLLLVGVAFASQTPELSLDTAERGYYPDICFKKIVKCCYKFEKCGYYCKWYGYKKVCYIKFCPKLHCDPEVIEGDSKVPAVITVKVKGH